MNSLWTIFLGAGGAAGAGSLFWTIYRDIRDRHIREQKVEGEIQIDTVTEKRIAAEAAQINSDVAIAQQTWWKEQFELLRVELTEEQKERRRVTKWARLHQAWDQRAYELAVLSDPDYPRPPQLEDM